MNNSNTNNSNRLDNRHNKDVRTNEQIDSIHDQGSHWITGNKRGAGGRSHYVSNTTVITDMQGTVIGYRNRLVLSIIMRQHRLQLLLHCWLHDNNLLRLETLVEMEGLEEHLEHDQPDDHPLQQVRLQ